MKYYIGIDLGGTSIKTGVVDEDFNIVGRGVVDTVLPSAAEVIADDMVKSALLAVESAHISMDDVVSVGVGTPGAVDRSQGVVVFSCNLDFHFVKLKDLVEARINKPTYLENDANAAAYGEAIAGGAKGYKNVVALTLGTGVGGGIIINGDIYSGFNNCGAEMGHSVIVHNGRQCNCGRKGCLEAYASASALINMTKETMEKNRDSILWKLCDGEITNVNGKTAFDAMRAGDAAGKAVVDAYIGYLGCGIVDYINIFQPEIFIIGGGICKEGDYLLKPLQEIVDRESYCVDPEHKTMLKIAKLGNDAGIIGAAFLCNLDK